MTITYTGDADWEVNINVQVEGAARPAFSIFPQPDNMADFARAGPCCRARRCHRGRRVGELVRRMDRLRQRRRRPIRRAREDRPEVARVLDLWMTEGAVYSAAGSIAATAFQDNGEPLVNGECMMHRQASFYAAFFPADTAYADGSEGAVDVFYFPSIKGDFPVLGTGTLATGFNADPETMAVLEYLSTPDYAEARQRAQTELKGGGLSGFLSAAKGQDPSVYQPLEQSFLDILDSAEVVRFDASDLMPADVGAGSFWTEGTNAVNGNITAQEAADRVEASWPS